MGRAGVVELILGTKRAGTPGTHDVHRKSLLEGGESIPGCYFFFAGGNTFQTGIPILMNVALSDLAVL
jgi:hypothetical protein